METEDNLRKTLKNKGVIIEEVSTLDASAVSGPSAFVRCRHEETERVFTGHGDSVVTALEAAVVTANSYGY